MDTLKVQDLVGELFWKMARQKGTDAVENVANM